METRVLAVGVGALVMSAGLGLACSDAASNVSTSPDGGAEGEQTSDAGKTDGASSNADASASAPVTALSTTRIANAINPYGLTYASDGFLYASGATMDGAVRKLAVWRFKDGVLDATFGTQGVITTDIAGDETSYDIVEVSAGNFVVQAVSGGKVYLVNLTSTGGTFAFGTPKMVPFAWANGVLTGWTGASAPAYASWGIGLDKSVAGTPKIVVFASGAPAKVATGTQRNDSDRWIARVLADTLEPDPAFNDAAAFSVDADGKGIGDNARRGMVLDDGSIVSAGYTDFGPGLLNHVVLIRLLADGTVDPAFGFGTSASIPGQTKFNPFVDVAGFAEAYDVVRQSSGRYVTTGYGTSHFDGPSKGLDLVSFGVKADGLDTTYGKLGSVAVQSEKDKSAGLGAAAFAERGRAMTILPDDRTVHVGVYDDFATVFVFDKDGKLDPSSGNNGVIEFGYPAAFYQAAVSPDGKHVAATAQSLNQTGDAAAPLGSIVVTLAVGAQ